MAIAKKINKKKSAKKATSKTTVAKVPVKKPLTEEQKAKFVPHRTRLQAGDKAPDFNGVDQFGKTISLNSLQGKNIVLYFYPKDDTPGCTAEACSLRDEHQYLSKQNYVVIGVSADNERSHKKFTTKYDLPFSLLPDPDKTIINAYDVWGTKMFMGRIYDGILRTTFIINEKGIISQVITDVNTKEHAQQILGL